MCGVARDVAKGSFKLELPPCAPLCSAALAFSLGWVGGLPLQTRLAGEKDWLTLAQHSFIWPGSMEPWFLLSPPDGGEREEALSSVSHSHQGLSLAQCFLALPALAWEGPAASCELLWPELQEVLLTPSGVTKHRQAWRGTKVQVSWGH